MYLGVNNKFDTKQGPVLDNSSLWEKVHTFNDGYGHVGVVKTDRIEARYVAVTRNIDTNPSINLKEVHVFQQSEFLVYYFWQFPIIICL